MPKYTPNPNLPEALYRAMTENNEYYDNQKSDYSISDLLNPPQVVQLTKRHDDEIILPYYANFLAMLGTGVHNLLEAKAKSLMIDGAEERLFYEIDGTVISGEPDVFTDVNGGIVDDYKLIKVSRLPFCPDPHWEEQTNSYVQLLRWNGKKVDKLRIIALLKDWSEIEIDRKKGYPQSPVVIFEIPMWNPMVAESFIQERLTLHKNAAILPDNQLPECSDKERWRKYEVRKRGETRTHKRDTKLEADRLAEELGGKVFVKPGRAIRCDLYCSALPFCQQIRRENEAK